VKQDIQEGENLGVRGVPFFVFDRKYGISGAEPIEVFTKTLLQTGAE
jgi:protein disulfide-isomerase